MRFLSPVVFSLATSASAFSSVVRINFAVATAASIGGTSNSSKTSSSFDVSATGEIHEAIQSSTKLYSSSSNGTTGRPMKMIDPDYPGTAVERMLAVRARVASLSKEDLNGDWEKVRRKLLWAGGLKDLPNARPGQGYTGHSFNDYNHVDLTCMRDDVSDNENDGSVERIAIGNQLGEGIRRASLPELGSGGSWSTCAIGCNRDPPRDVAHVQFRSRVAFKLVWCPVIAEDDNNRYGAFVLVDDDGKELARGNPTGRLPSLRERQVNYQIVAGSKYAVAADKIAAAAAKSQAGASAEL